MLKGLYTAYSGLLNEQNRMEVLTNNLANVSTNGFKKEGTTSEAFSDILAYKIKDTSDAPNLAKKLGTMNMGVKIGENYTDYSEGSFKQTGNPYDLAISGGGFFTVEYTNKEGDTSTKYTRDGAFTVSKDGYLVTKDGDFVMGARGRIKLSPNLTTSISEDGTVSQGGTTIDRLEITDFEDYNYLEHFGENFYQTVEGAETKDSEATIQSGYLETSNVQTVSEMVEMISISRAYEANQKIVQTYDKSLEIAVNRIGKI